MDVGFPTVEVREGAARLLVPDIPRRRGPGRRGPLPFYNPTASVSRDVSAVVLRRWPIPVRRALDGLAGTGAWGIRMALEASLPDVTFNDRLAAAGVLLRANVARNRVAGAVRVGDLRDALGYAPFDLVDVDPFGPPTPYLDVVFRAAPAPSGVGITATDTAPLCGTYPAACRRRYGATPLRCDQGAEIGLRILLGYAERAARAHGRSLRPVLAYAVEHFLRIHALVVDASAHPTPEPVGHVVRRDDGAFVQVPAATDASLGPMWLGPLSDADVLRRLAPSEWTSAAAGRLLATLQGEAGLPAFFATTDELAARARASPPRLERALDALRAAGFRAARTHLHPRGVRTDAPHGDVVRIVGSLMRA